MASASPAGRAPGRDVVHLVQCRRSHTSAGRSLSGHVLATGEPVTSADFAADERASQAARGAMSQIGPAVLFPLGVPGNVRGVLTVGPRHGAAPFPQAQADVVASFAAQAGVALELD